MEMVRAASGWILLASWLAFSGLLAWNHLRVRGERKRQGVPEEKPAIRDPRSMLGLAIEGLSFFVALGFRQRPSEASDWMHLASIVFGVASVWLLAAALRHLGMEWRIKAVVTDDHRLITTGPYAWMRHPVFASLTCLLLATVLLITRPWAAVTAVAICLAGTEIRIRAEDGLLARRFGARYREYQQRTAAYVPFVR